MPLVKTILFAADFSESSRQAFRLACSLAREGESRILVVHVLEAVHIAMEPIASGPSAAPFSIDERYGGYHEAVKERLRETYVPTTQIDIQYQTRDGAPAEEILRVAEEIGADLIAMGTHGRTGLSRIRAGSVAETVLREARCPVLAIRSTDAVKEPVREVRAILAAIDFSDDSKDAARVARSIAAHLGARLVLLHVATMDVVPGVVPMVYDLQPDHDFLAALKTQFEGPDLKAPIEVVLRQGVAASEILSVAETMGCDLIVIGTHGRSGIVRLLMGSVAEAVLRRANCPVLMIKPAAHVRRSTAESELYRGSTRSTDGNTPPSPSVAPTSSAADLSEKS
jgi:nucleotide-binding universal stress UspA family protein